MQGSIYSFLGVSSGAISQHRIANALHIVAPLEYNARARDLLVKTNPLPYYAPYFGYKAHLDQNEILAMYGCTHMIMVDGCSRYILGYASMPLKNPISIYENIYPPVTLEIWALGSDQSRSWTGVLFDNFYSRTIVPFEKQPRPSTILCHAVNIKLCCGKVLARDKQQGLTTK